MWYLVASIPILLLVFVWWIQRPLYHRRVRPEEFESFLREFSNQGAEGSLLFIEHENSSRFVQFAKYCSNQGETILHFGFPDAPWSRQYFDPLEKMFQTLGIEFNITTGEGLIHRFLEIDLEKEDLENKILTGAHVARVAFEVMGLGENDRFKIHFKGDLSTEAVRPSLELLRDAPNKLVRGLSRHYSEKVNAENSKKKNSKDRDTGRT